MFPSWPVDKWDISFKLYAPLNTTIEASCINGTLAYFSVIPEERKKDIIINNCKQSEIMLWLKVLNHYKQ